MPLQRGRTALASAVVLLVGGVACSGDEEGQDWSPLPPVPPAAVEDPTDRPAEVVAATAALDPCALLDPDLLRGRGLPELEQPDALGPHVCRVALAGTRGVREVRLALGVPFGQDERFVRQRVVLSGATGYLQSYAGQREGCEVTFPISLEIGIALSTSFGDCAEVRSVAAAAAAGLATRPGRLARPRGPGRHQACALLAGALGDVPEGYELRANPSLGQGFDECGVWQVSEGALQAVAPRVQLDLENGFPVVDQFAGYDGRPRQVAGRPGFEYRLGGPDCLVSWAARRTDVASSRPLVIATVTAPTCRRAVELAERVDAEARRPVLTAPAARVLYLRGESDLAAVGACADLHQQAARRCAPYDEVDVPGDPVDLLRHAEADPDVACAAALDTVRDEVDQELEPVTADASTARLLDDDGEPVEPVRRCVFVEPDHELWVTVQASTRRMAEAPDTEVAGHDAATVDVSLGEERHVVVAATTAEEPGHLRIVLNVMPSREHGWWQGAPVDRSPLRRFDALAEALVEKLL